MFELEADLKDPSLRWYQAKDFTINLGVNGQRRNKDHLYFHGPNVLGIYVERKTRREFGFTVKRWERLLGDKVVHDSDDQMGDLDGIVRFRADKLGDIPQDFFKGAHRPPTSASRIDVQGSDGGLVPSGPVEGQISNHAGERPQA